MPSPPGMLDEIAFGALSILLRHLETFSPDRRGVELAKLGERERSYADSYLCLHPERRWQYLREICQQNRKTIPEDQTQL